MNQRKYLWPAVERLPPAAADGVEVFAIDLERMPSPDDWDVLSPTEAARARRFVFPVDRDRYVGAHAAARRVLAAYCGIPPAKIAFETDGHGKPHVVQLPGCGPVRFNLSHSSGLALLAVAVQFEIGVDVEILRPVDKAIAEQYFSVCERQTLNRLPENGWLRGFFRCWTSKEALLKGEGLGLNVPLDAFDVEANPEHAPALLASRAPAELRKNWKLVELLPADGAMGILAVRDDADTFTVNRVRCFHLTV